MLAQVDAIVRSITITTARKHLLEMHLMQKKWKLAFEARTTPLRHETEMRLLKEINKDGTCVCRFDCFQYRWIAFQSIAALAFIVTARCLSSAKWKKMEKLQPRGQLLRLFTPQALLFRIGRLLSFSQFPALSCDPWGCGPNFLAANKWSKASVNANELGVEVNASQEMLAKHLCLGFIPISPGPRATIRGNEQTRIKMTAAVPQVCKSLVVKNVSKRQSLSVSSCELSRCQLHLSWIHVSTNNCITPENPGPRPTLLVWRWPCLPVGFGIWPQLATIAKSSADQPRVFLGSLIICHSLQFAMAENCSAWQEEWMQRPEPKSQKSFCFWWLPWGHKRVTGISTQTPTSLIQMVLLSTAQRQRACHDFLLLWCILLVGLWTVDSNCMPQAAQLARLPQLFASAFGRQENNIE